MVIGFSACKFHELIAAGLLIKKGFKVNEALEKISEIRQLNVPDTEAQIEWLKEIAEILNKLKKSNENTLHR